MTNGFNGTMKKAKHKTKLQLYDQMRRGLMMFLAAIYELATEEKPDKPKDDPCPKRDPSLKDG